VANKAELSLLDHLADLKALFLRRLTGNRKIFCSEVTEFGLTRRGVMCAFNQCVIYGNETCL
jgi:hypothetical protein